MPYRETQRGNYLYLNPFSQKPSTAQEHWDHAEALRERGQLKRARKEFEIFVKRWPGSVQAAAASQAVADIYFEQGKNSKAFKAYEELVQQYYTGITDYDTVLDRQHTAAEHEMNRKRMRWLFGGYRAPERAVPYFESIIRNAPQWDRAPEMQYTIGRAYHENKDYELAVVAYATVEYRYPDSPYAEKAAVAKLESLKALVDVRPYSLEIREQAQMSAGLFPELYPDSPDRDAVAAFAAELHSASASYNYEIGQFYERVPRPAQTESAAIYYRKVIRNYGDTDQASQSADRLRVILHDDEGPQDGVVIESAVAAAQVLDVDGESGGGSLPMIASGKAGMPVETKELPERTATDESAVEITADRMEYAGDLLIGEGNVAFQQAGASLQADRVTVDQKSGIITASGNILMIRDGSRWEGQDLVYNYKTREGTFGESFMFFDPVYITAGTTERISTNEYVMRDVMMTTCEGADPIVYARAKEVRVLDEDKPGGVFIKAKHVTFYAGPVPVFYTPVWQRHLGYRVFTFTVGYGGRLGAFVMGSANLRPTDWLRTGTHVDLYSKRGVGLGQDFKWTTPNGAGEIRTYYINDRDAQSDDDSLYPPDFIDSRRYRVKLAHREQLTDETYFSTRFNLLSDPEIIEDFFNDEFRHEVNPENFAVVQHVTGDYAASARIDRSLNDFYTTVERIPELTYDWYRARVGDSPFYFESENNIAFLEKLHAETNRPPVLRDDNYRSARIDSYNQIFLPLRFKEFFNVIPRAGYRGTWYSETATGASDANLRNIFEAGVLTSFKAHKTLTEKSAFFGTGLRHTVEPYADYLYRAEPNLKPADLHRFDSVDELGEQNAVRFGMRNYLQTKRGQKRIVNFLDSDIYTTYRLDPQSDAVLFGQPAPERDFGPLVADAEMSVTDNFFIQGDLRYDWHTHELTPGNARLRFVSADQSEYALGYRYRNDSFADRSLLTASAKLFPNDKWSYEFFASYDGKHEEWYERKILVNRRFDCVGMGVGLKVDEDDEVQFWMQFWLTAFDKPATHLGY